MSSRTAHPAVIGGALKNHAALAAGEGSTASPDLMVTLVTKLCEDALKQSSVSMKLVSAWRGKTASTIRKLVDQEMRLLSPEVRMILATQVLMRGVTTGTDVLLESSSDDQVMSGATRHSNDPMLTTEQAAKMMGYSRTHVAMLVDNDQLPGSVKSSGKHRRIPQSAVKAYMAAHKPSAGAGDYRTAAQAAGMYSLPETAYLVKPKRARATKKS